MKKIYNVTGFLLVTFGLFTSACNNDDQNLSKEEIVSKIEEDSNKIVTSIEKENNSTYEVEISEKNHKKTLIVEAKNAKVKKEENDRDILDDKALDILYNDEFVITSKEAKQIALNQVKDGTITEIEKEKDDKQFYYSVEVMKEHINYSIEIDAKSGKVISIEQEDIFLND